MWDETDYASHWIQGICAIFLALFAFGGVYMVLNSSFLMFRFGGLAVFLGSLRLCWRCFRYAVTGKNNVNRDDY